MKIKCGIIIFKKVGDDLFFLLILKKYTYAFMRLLLGKYSSKCLLQLEGNISIYEKKILLMKKDIQQMYRKYFPNFNTRSGELLKIKNKFEWYKKHIRKKTGREFYEWLKEIPTTFPPWEIPKGNIQNGENLFECALREINEETGVKKRDLSILDRKYDEMLYPKLSYPVKIYYFVAEYISAKVIDEKNIQDGHEVMGTGWFGIDELEHLRISEKQKKIIKDVGRLY